ncbi:MAG: DUF2147 domain-containing protein [Pseudomonadota bacterium]
MLARIICALTLSAAFMPAQAEVTPIDAISGTWVTEGYGAVVRINPCTDDRARVCGELVWIWDENDLVPARNADPMLVNFRYENGAWRGGRLASPVSSRVYRGTITQRNADTLDLMGCAARVFCADQTWRRLESLPHVTAE